MQKWKQRRIISKPDGAMRKKKPFDAKISDSMPDNQIQSVGSRPRWPAPVHPIQNR